MLITSDHSHSRLSIGEFKPQRSRRGGLGGAADGRRQRPARLAAAPGSGGGRSLDMPHATAAAIAASKPHAAAGGEAGGGGRDGGGAKKKGDGAGGVNQALVMTEYSERGLYPFRLWWPHDTKQPTLVLAAHSAAERKNFVKTIDGVIKNIAESKPTFGWLEKRRGRNGGLRGGNVCGRMARRSALAHGMGHGVHEGPMGAGLAKDSARGLSRRSARGGAADVRADLRRHAERVCHPCARASFFATVHVCA